MHDSGSKNHEISVLKAGLRQVPKELLCIATMQAYAHPL